MDLHKIRTQRQATIDQAVDLIDTASREDMLCYLADVDPLGDLGFHDHLRVDPPALRDCLRSSNDPLFKYGWAWMISRRILQAAGLPS